MHDLKCYREEKNSTSVIFDGEIYRGTINDAFNYLYAGNLIVQEGRLHIAHGDDSIG